MPVSVRDYCSTPRIACGDWRLELGTRVAPPPGIWDLASVASADMVRLVADAFLDAGADILTTHTPKANAITMDGNPIAEINRQWATLCRAAIESHPRKNRLLLGTIGPVEPLITLNEITADRLEAAYTEQASALASGGVDGFLCHGFTELAALRAAVSAADKVGLPVIACMTFDSASEPPTTALGITIAQAVAELSDAGVAALGGDVGDSPESMVDVVTTLRKATSLPLWATITPGSPQLVDGRVVYVEKPADFASRAPALRKAGASIIAGGRGVSAAHIAALASLRK